MEIENKYKYYAFISYKREDEDWAKWLQHKLEHYKLPSNLNGRTDLPKEIRPVFKDTSELNPGNLPQQIHDALEQSKHLIVICSPRSAQSEWVNKEVETFMGMGKTDRIIPFIIDGKAFAKDPAEECFPAAIRNLPSEQEILGANIGEMGRDAAAVKVVAQMFGLKFDELWQRHEREQRRKRNWIIAVSIIGFLIMTGIAFWMYAQRQQTLKANWKMMENQARAVAEKAMGNAEKDSYLARMLAIEILPNDLNHPERPYTPEAEMALRKSACLNTAILKGPTSPIESAAFSPDGKQIVSDFGDNTIRIWDAQTGKQIGNPLVEGYNLDVRSVTFSPDGKLIVSFFFNDNTIRIWDAQTGKPLGDPIEVKGHNSYVSSVAISPDGKRIVSASLDETIRIWDAQTGKPLGDPMEGHTNTINSVAFSPDGQYIVSASGDNTIRIWDAQTGKQIDDPLEGHTSYVSSAVFSPDGERIVSASGDNTIRIWDFPPLQELIDQTRERFKDRPLTPEERRMYYLE